MSIESDAFALEHGHPPVAHNTICVDFDQTLYPYGDLFGDHPPLPGAVEAMRAFKAAGLRIIIFTSRLSPAWWRSEGWDEYTAWKDQVVYISSILARDEIPFDGLTGEKIPAIAYIDDKAVEFKNNWEEVQERVLAL